MDRTGITWDENEITLCLGLYYLYSSGMVSYKKGVIKLGNLLGRSEGSVKLKLGNISNCDNPLKGLPNINKLDLIVFKKYGNNLDNLFLDIGKILSMEAYRNRDASILLDNNPYSDLYDTNLPDHDCLRDSSLADYSAEDKEGFVRVREKQWAFRMSLLSNYGRTCCVSGIVMPQLLVASHIVPWAADKTKRLDPSNGLLLNAMLDRAFDQGLITFHPEKRSLIISDRIKDEKTLGYLSSYDGHVLTLPKHSNAIPSKENLEYHNDVIFNSYEDDWASFRMLV